jgi:hypothetical protein
LPGSSTSACAALLLAAKADKGRQRPTKADKGRQRPTKADKRPTKADKGRQTAMWFLSVLLCPQIDGFPIMGLNYCRKISGHYQVKYHFF